MSSTNKQPFHLKYPVPLQQIYQGIVYPGRYMKTSVLPRVREFEVREDDVAVMSYPRTGSRWVCEMVYLICANGDEDLETAISLMKVPRIESLSTLYSTEEEESEQPLKVWIDSLSEMSTNKQRIYCSHLQFHFAPRQLAHKGKIISAIRNPKDNAVSWYHYYQSIGLLCGFYKGSWEDFLEGYMAGELIWGSYLDWLKSWWPRRENKNMLILRYEEMKRDHVGTVKKIADFLGKSLDENTVQKIVEKTSFKAMKESPLTNISRNEYFLKLQGIDLDSTNGPLKTEIIRKGEVGDWKNYFTVNQSTEFDQLVKGKFAGLDLEFEYE